MGYAIAAACAEEGAEVILVSGPVHLEIPHPSIRLVRVTTAAEMAEACIGHFPGCRAGILTAAVADYTPVASSARKLKRGDGRLSIELEPTRDIAAELGRMKKESQVLVGFALETENERANALEKIRKKHLDFIVLNSLRDEGAGFEVDTNKISIIDADNNVDEYELKSKEGAARDIIGKLMEYV